MMQQDLIDALRVIDASVVVEHHEEESLRVSLPGRPGMILREDFYRHSLNNPAALLVYAERVVEKIRKEIKK